MLYDTAQSAPNSINTVEMVQLAMGLLSSIVSYRIVSFIHSTFQ